MKRILTPEQKSRANFRQRRWYKKHRIRLNEQSKRRAQIEYQKNPELFRERARRCYCRHRAAFKERAVAYYAENRIELLARQKKFREDNRDAVLKSKRERYAKHRARYSAVAALRAREARQKSPELVREKENAYKAKRWRENLSFRLVGLTRTRIRRALRGALKSEETEELIGCPIVALIRHLEKQFQPGMTWENHGVDGWHIDPIRPCASFDLTDSGQQKLCFHYTNLQPLWAHGPSGNLAKGSTWKGGA